MGFPSVKSGAQHSVLGKLPWQPVLGSASSGWHAGMGCPLMEEAEGPHTPLGRLE